MVCTVRRDQEKVECHRGLSMGCIAGTFEVHMLVEEEARA